jgi:hypothetical protein
LSEKRSNILTPFENMIFTLLLLSACAILVAEWDFSQSTSVKGLFILVVTKLNFP